MTNHQKIPTLNIQKEPVQKHRVQQHNPQIDDINTGSSNGSSDFKQWIREQALDLGFADCGFISVKNPLFTKQMTHLKEWLKKGYEGDLHFLHNNHDLREHPEKMVEGTKTIISVRMDYLTEIPERRTVADDNKPNNAIIARYARGRDYHKVMRSRLKQLAKRIEAKITEQDSKITLEGASIEPCKEPFVYRPFADSAPIFERAIADEAGLGWTGKNTLLINRKGGSFFVLGELFMSLEIEEDKPVSAHCGKCVACIDICPTNAIVAPYELNASACISYLTIEHKGSIPLKYRKAIGNRIFGCDDCQLICPWNGYAKVTTVDDFNPRNGLDNVGLLDLWQWSEEAFNNNTQGSPIRRTGYESFLRNIAIGIGNTVVGQQKIKTKEAIAAASTKVRKKPKIYKTQITKSKLESDKEYNNEIINTQMLIDLLSTRINQNGEVVDEHIYWAIEQLKTTEFAAC